MGLTAVVFIIISFVLTKVKSHGCINLKLDSLLSYLIRRTWHMKEKNISVTAGHL